MLFLAVWENTKFTYQICSIWFDFFLFFCSSHLIKWSITFFVSKQYNIFLTHLFFSKRYCFQVRHKINNNSWRSDLRYHNAFFFIWQKNKNKTLRERWNTNYQKLFADETMILNFLEESISIVDRSWNQNLLTHVGWWCFILLDMKPLFDAFVTFGNNIKMSGFAKCNLLKRYPFVSCNFILYLQNLI